MKKEILEKIAFYQNELNAVNRYLDTSDDVLLDLYIDIANSLNDIIYHYTQLSEKI
ncbi:hypothetical protein [Prevotella pectinovora]|uniref:hypothetical protein n=1 Tax=Prevotella pectinovora TaxID=1602169 RepID=UPI00307A72CC